jgi:mannose-6-phosphate isomerase-like protein (cupin superfamily)
MVGPGDVLQVPEAGIRLEIRATGAETGGEYAEFDVIGRPRGLFAGPHVHEMHAEHIEVVEGALRLKLDGRERVLRPGERVVVPIGSSHSQAPYRDEPYHIRVQWRPPTNAEAFGEQVAAMSASGGLTRWGWPRPVAAARLGVAFGRYSHPTWPPLPVQLATAKIVVRAADAAASARARLRARAAARR